MARNAPSRDQIAHDVFGRKFSALELDQKQYVNKLLGVLYNASRQGGDPSRLLSTAAMNETAKIVKQLKEIATNPGDVISLPKGVYQDAARVIHYQSQANGRGRLLDPREMDKIKKEIAKEFGRVNPGLVAGITDYLTNATGRFSGVGSKVLRSKLGSFLTKGELESISNAEILAARDIVVSHLFDKWSGGNLSSFIKSRLEDVLEDQRKGLRGLKSEPKSINRAELENTIRALEIIKEANSNLNYANRADFRFACKNLGIDFSKIVSPQARGHSANVMHKLAQASSRAKLGKAQWDDERNIPALRQGSGLRFNRRTHRSPVEIKSVYGTGNWATTIRENAARLASDIPSVDMYEYRGTPAEEHWGLDERVDYGALAEDAIESVQEIKEVALEATWKRIVKNGIPETEFVPMGRGAQNIAKMLGYTGGTTSRSGEATFNKITRRMNGWDLTTTSPSAPVDVHGKIAPAHRETTLFRSSHIEPRIVSGTDARALSRLHEAVGIEEENMDIAVLNEIDEYIDRYGKHGKALYEAWVPLHSDDPQYGKLVTTLLTNKGRVAYWAREQLIEKFGNTFPRFEREIREDTSEKKATGGYRAMEPGITHLDAVSRIFDDESGRSLKFIGAAEKFREYFNSPSGDVVNLPKHMELYRELAGLGAVKGVKRIGVVGSKSWDNERFMRKFLNKNIDRDDILITSTEVGKPPRKELKDFGGDEQKFAEYMKFYNKTSFGSAYQAANWAYWENVMHNKLPTRTETLERKSKPGKFYDVDYTTADVINNSDEVVAFFDEMYLSPSGRKQMDKLAEAIGDKPCRIIWVPSNTAQADGSVHAGQYALKLFGDNSNVKFEKYHPGALPKGMSDKGFKFLAKGGPLKSNEMAIVGEAGPELLVPSGSGGFNVIPNSHLRFLEAGTFTPKKDVGVVTGEQNPAGEHFYRTPAGALFPSVSTIIRYGTKEMQKEMEVFDHIPGWVSDVGTEIHRQVALEMTKRLHGDTSRFETPVDFTKSQGRGRNRTPESLKQMADAAAPNVIKKLDELGFVVGAVEQRFVDFNRGFSGTLDLLGYIDGTPTLIDIKSSSSAPEEKESHRLQLGAYASFFEKDAMPKLMHILPVNRETGEASNPPIIYGEDAIKDAVASFENQRVSFDYRLHRGDFFNNPNIKDNVEFLRPLIDVHSAVGKLETAIPGLVKAVEENYNVVGEQKYVGEYLNTLANGLKSGGVEMTPQVSSIINLFRKVESVIGDASGFGAGKIRDQISKENTDYLKKISTIPVAQSKNVSSTGKYTADQEDAASARWATWLMSLVPTYDKRSGETYDRPILTSLKDHNAALAKYLPKYGAVGATAEETWDKNPSRLRIYEARLNELLQSRRTVGVHPSIEASLKELETRWDLKDIMQLASHDIGEEDDDPKSIQLFHKVYTDLIKSMGTEKEWQSVLGGTSAMEKMRWEDARTLVNILEEAGKSFKSVPRFSLDNLYTPPTSSSIIPTTVPGPGMPGSPLNPTSASPGTPQNGNWFVPSTPPLGIPSVMTGAPVASAGGGYGAGTPIPTSAGSSTRDSGKRSAGCKGVDLCTKTINSLRKMINAAAKAIGQAIKRFGGGGGSKSGGGRGKGGGSPIPNVPDLGARGLFEKLPIVGLPLEMKRKWQEATDAVEQYDINTGSMDQYNRLLANEDKARKGYYRSIRGATTSFLIAQHALRVFGQTSQVVNKGSEAVGKGLGYIMDMFLMPLVPFLRPIIGMLVGIGNAVRMFSNPMWHLLAGILLVKIAKGFYDIGKAIYDAPNKLDLLNEALGNLNTTISHLVNGAVVTPTGMPVTGPVPTSNQYNSPIGPKPPRKSIYNRAKEWLGFSDGGVVPGVGNKDSVLAMLTPGEVVISKNNLPHYADGGVVGGVIGNVLGLYGNIMSTDIAQSIVGGLGVVSKAVGAMMAPLAPVMAMGAIGGKGWAAVRNAVTRGTSITTQVQEGGFSSLRTVGSGILMSTISIAGAAIGILNLLSGLQPVMPTGNMPKFSATDALKGVAERIRAIWEEIKAKALEKWEQIKAKAWEIWEKIRSKALEIWERIKAPFERVKTFIDTIFDKFKGVVDTLRTAFERAKLALDPLIERFKGMAEFIKTHFPDIGKGGKGVIESVKEFGGKALEKVTKGGYLPTAGLVGLNEIFKGETDPVKILTAVAPAMAGQWVFNKLGGMQAFAGAGGQALLGGAGGFLANPFFKDLGSNAENFFRRITGGEESENAWGGRMIASTAGSMLMGVPGVVGAGLNDWYNNLTEVFGKMSSGDLPFITGNNQGVVGTAMKETWNAYGNIVQAFKGEYEPGNSLIFDAIYNAGASFRDGATKFIDDLQSGFTNIVNTIISIPEMIMTKLATIADDIKNAIINSITGTGNGILDAGSNAVNSVVDVAQKLPIPKFDTGGYVGKSGLAWVDKGESITTIGAPSTRTATNTDLLHAVQDLKDALKQPTVNYNTIEMANSDPYALFQQFVQWLGTAGNTQGLQRSI